MTSVTAIMSSSGTLGDRLVNSPVLKKPKKPTLQAAQSRRASYETGDWLQDLYSRSRMAGVMGSRRRLDGFVERRRPFRTYESRGNGDVAGSGREAEICRWRTADR